MTFSPFRSLQRSPTLTWVGGLCLAACVGPGAAAMQDAKRYSAAIPAIAADPSVASTVCASITQLRLRADCVTAGAEQLARTQQVDGAVDLCSSLPPGLGRDECFFQIADRSGEVRFCGQAGRFADDCRVHGWNRLVERNIDTQASFVVAMERMRPLAMERMRPLALEAGFSAEDRRPWIVLFRVLHGSRRPLDLAHCLGLDDGTARLCLDAAMMLLNDRLAHARNSREWPCGASPPELLMIADDAVLQAIVDESRSETCR